MPVAEKQIVNEKEFRVYSLGRTGHHAVIYWIAEYHPKPVLFMNSVLGVDRPFGKVASYWSTSPEHTELEKEGKNFPKKLFMFSVEVDKPLAEAVSMIENPTGEQWEVDGKPSMSHRSDMWQRGESGEITNLVLLRDPFNWAASFLKKGRSIKRFVPFYKELYYSVVSGKPFEERPFPILFNEWFLYDTYRKWLGDTLGLEGEYWATFDYVTPQGDGSSFDGGNLQGRASDMNVCGRWRIMANHPEMKMLANDEELVEIATSLFGHLHPIEGWAKAIRSA